MKRIGIIGLGLKNPYTYAPILKLQGAKPTCVWDTYAENARDYAKTFDCTPVEDLDDFPTDDVDGVIIESINSEHLKLAKGFVERGIPAFIEKPMSNDPQEVFSFLDEFPDAPLFSASPLRFSPAYQEMQREIYGKQQDTIRLCKVSVYHTMAHFLADEQKIWHDKPSQGGGMLIDIGIHAIELLNMFMPKPYGRIEYLKSNTYYRQSESGDCHSVTIEYLDGSVGQLSLLCATDRLDYAVEAYSERNSYINTNRERYLGEAFNADNAYGGFVGTMEAFLNMIDTGIPPISPEETRRNFTLIQNIQANEKRYTT